MANNTLLQYPNKAQFKLTIPKGLVLAKGWKKGEKLTFSLTPGGNLLVKPMNGKKLVKKATLQLLNNTQFMITLPKELVLAKRWAEGDKLEFVFDDNTNIIIKKAVEHEAEE